MRSRNLLLILLLIPFITAITIYAQASSNYVLQEYGFGAGGLNDSQSANYAAVALTGEQSSEQIQSTNYAVLPGLAFTHLANVPPAPTVTNPASYYNKLNLIINTSNNPSDTLYAIAVSTDNFVSNTQYIQNDQTLGASLGSEDWQTYTAWGGVSGFNVLGLNPATIYYFRSSARQGKFTQSGYGPIASVATVNPTMSFDIDIAATDTESSPPYNLSLGALSTSGVTTATDKVWIDMTTNSENGSTVYIYSNGPGLESNTTNYTITSTPGNLASLDEGFGARGDTTAQTAGGPLTRITPYNGTNDNVGIVDTTIRSIFNTSSLPITNARGSIAIKARARTVTPAASDYQTVFYLIASGNY